MNDYKTAKEYFILLLVRLNNKSITNDYEALEE